MADRFGGMKPVGVVGIIDVGSNSIHLAIGVSFGNDHFEILETEKYSLRLGSFVQDGVAQFPQATIDTLIQVLSSMRRTCEFYGASLKAVATYAFRHVPNPPELTARIYEQSGVSLEIISGTREAELCFLGASTSIKPSENDCLTIDVGGGSTEIGCGQPQRPTLLRSLDLGAVTLTRRISQEQWTIEQRSSYIKHCFDECFAGCVAEQGNVQSVTNAIASSGSAKILVQLSKALFSTVYPKKPNGFKVGFDDIQTILNSLDTAGDPVSIERQFGIERARADIARAGVAILHGFMKSFHVNELTVSTSGLREGLLVESFSSTTSNTDYWVSSRNMMMRRHRVNQPYIDSLMKLKDSLWRLRPGKARQSQLWQRLQSHEYILDTAIGLHTVGSSVSMKSFPKHSSYIIRNSNIYGFSQMDTEMIAFIVRGHRKLSECGVEEYALSEQCRNCATYFRGILRLITLMRRIPAGQWSLDCPEDQHDSPLTLTLKAINHDERVFHDQLELLTKHRLRLMSDLGTEVIMLSEKAR